MTDQQELERLVKAIDLLADRLTGREKQFIIDMVDRQPQQFSPAQASWIEGIAQKHGIL